VEEPLKETALKPASDDTEAPAVRERPESGNTGVIVADGSETSSSEDGYMKKKGEVDLDKV